MSPQPQPPLRPASLSSEAKELLGRFDSLWQQPDKPRIDDFLAACPENQRLAMLIELAHSELEFRLRGGDSTRTEEYVSRFPELREPE